MQFEALRGDISATEILLYIPLIRTDRSVSKNNPEGDPSSQPSQLHPGLSTWSYVHEGLTVSQPPLLLTRLESLRSRFDPPNGETLVHKPVPPGDFPRM